MNDQLNSAALAEIAAVKGQLLIITQLIQNGHQATHQRIDDMRSSLETRVGGVERRLETIEKNERGTAIRAASTGGLAGAIVAAGIALFRHGA